jgi:stage V sporulation protein B
MNNIKSLYKNPFVAGTLLLTLSSLITKFIGFFYRIFISRIFTEEALGIFGLTAPVMMLVTSVCAMGIQSAVTRYVAASNNKDSSDSYSYLFTGMFISVALSTLLAYFVFNYSLFISTQIIGERRCAPLLKLCALSFPPAAIHSCINGFFYGQKKTFCPSASVIIEQLVRVITVFSLYKLTVSFQANVSLSYLCIGTLAGEFCAAVFSLITLAVNSYLQNVAVKWSLSYRKAVSIISLAFPISLSKIFIGLITAYETIKLPQKLIESGMTSKDALSVYGVFSGMAIPLIMFPHALTGSVASLLLPSVSEDESSGNFKHIRKTIILSTLFCFFVGIFCFLFFFIFADFIGDWLFKSDIAASQIRALSFLCPFLYISGTLSSILHGLGKTGITFIFNLISVIFRIGFVIFVVPNIGFSGYIYGNLCSQILLDLLIILALRRYFVYN